MSTPPGSGPQSPDNGDPPVRSSVSLFSHGIYGGGPLQGLSQSSGGPLDLILGSYVPHVAIYASTDTDELAQEKGFAGGIWRLLRPYGDRVPGKVTIRDSNGFSRTFEDFSIRFVKFGDDVSELEAMPAGVRDPTSRAINTDSASIFWGQRALSQLETLISRRLAFVPDTPSLPDDDKNTTTATTASIGPRDELMSPHFALYLKRLLSSPPLFPHETFAHPVACVILISSRSKNPITDLRRLYEDTTHGNGGQYPLPPWVDGDYLRYYVLVHDEERDEISRSMSLFDQMKRHFGVHCHLLRLRSTRSARTDDDSIPFPQTGWVSTAEELTSMEADEHGASLCGDHDLDDVATFIFESDVTAIRSFVREMVTQSLIPTMERRISVWNDQVASRRRGLAGRLMSLSKKWAGLGTAYRSPALGGSLGVGAGANPSGTYDALGFYRAESPEAIMRRLADFSFMLRDWKLAHSTYDLLRADFSNAQVWKYNAAANEMAAISLLMTPQNLLSSTSHSSQTRLDVVDQMLEAAFYSYRTRCGQHYGALRALLTGMELFKLQGGACIDNAIKWGMLLLGSKVLGPVGDALLRERLAVYSAGKQAVGYNGMASWPGSRRRKSGLWSILAAEAWIHQGKPIQALRCVRRARWAYASLPQGNGGTEFGSASQFLLRLGQIVDGHVYKDAMEPLPY